MASSTFETPLRLAGPWWTPAQILAEQDIGGRTSIHDDATAKTVGLQGGTLG